MNQQATNASQLAQVFPFIIFVITISFITPYLEELIYRGIFKETLFKKTSFWLPFIISSIVLVHNTVLIILFHLLCIHQWVWCFILPTHVEVISKIV